MHKIIREIKRVNKYFTILILALFYIIAIGSSALLKKIYIFATHCGPKKEKKPGSSYVNIGQNDQPVCNSSSY